MSLTNYFRVLLALFAVLVFAEIISSIATVPWLPEPLRNHVEAQMNDSNMSAQIAMLALLAWVAFSLMLISIIGLWFFWRPARLLYTLFLLFLACAVAASGTVVETALTTVLGFMNTIIAGLILGLIYFSPLREYFEAPSADAPPS